MTFEIESILLKYKQEKPQRSASKKPQTTRMYNIQYLTRSELLEKERVLKGQLKAIQAQKKKNKMKMKKKKNIRKKMGKRMGRLKYLKVKKGALYEGENHYPIMRVADDGEVLIYVGQMCDSYFGEEGEIQSSLPHPNILRHFNTIKNYAIKCYWDEIPPRDETGWEADMKKYLRHQRALKKREMVEEVAEHRNITYLSQNIFNFL